MFKLANVYRCIIYIVKHVYFRYTVLQILTIVYLHVTTTQLKYTFITPKVFPHALFSFSCLLPATVLVPLCSLQHGLFKFICIVGIYQ